MNSRLLDENGGSVYAVVFDSGDEVMEGLTDFAASNGISAAGFTAVGAFERATIAYFDVETREYEEIPVPEQVEVLTLAGTISRREGEPMVHAHVVLGRRDGTVRGGHLMNAIVRPTLEVIVTAAPAELRRRMNKETGLPLIDL